MLERLPKMKPFSNISYWVFTIFTIVLFSGCKKNEITENPNPIDASVDETPITYQSHIKLIIDNNCKGCHSPSPLNISPYLTSYEEVKQAAQQGTLLSVIFKSNPRAMPPNKPLTKQEKDMLTVWTNNNFPN